MFESWENFYIIIGPTAGALIGVMFVVTTLTAALDETKRARGGQIYITPVVFHLSVVVVVSAITAVPELPAETVGVLIALCSAAGLYYSTLTAIRVFTVKVQDNTDLSDKCFYGLFPIVLYLALAAVSASMWVSPLRATYMLGAVMVALVLLGIRNSWDLALFLVHPPEDIKK